MKSNSFYGAMATFAASTALSTPQAEAQDAFDLGTVVLTATGQEQSIADVQASVQVISQDTIQTSKASNASELLKDAVGLGVRSSGPNQVVTMRGQNSTGTLLLVDGQSRTGAYGSFNLNNISTQEIERIEIVRGPMSALYGADALGGVINVITKRPGDNPGKTVSVLLGTRPDDGDKTTLRFGTTIETGDETLGQRFALELEKADGYALPDTLTGEDFSALERASLAWSGSWVPSDGQELRWRIEAYRQNDEREATTSWTNIDYTALEKEDRISADVSWSQDLGQGRLTLSGLLSYSDGLANRAYPIEEGTIHTQAEFRARYDILLGDHNLSFAAGVEHEKISIGSYQDDVNEVQTFALIQDEWFINENIAMVAGLRVDHYEAFGTTVNPKISFGSRGDGFTWRASAGTAFRAPGISERYANITRGTSLIIGNTDLDAETSTSYELAGGWRDDTRNIELVYHNSKVEDLITTYSTGRVQNGFSVIEYMNVDEARIEGLELTANWQPSDQWNISGSVEYLDARDGVTNDRLTDRYRTAYSLAATYAVNDWQFTGRLRGLQGFLAADTNVSFVPYTSGFNVVDVNVVYSFDEVSKVSFGIDNVFDQEFDPNYSTAQYREDDGRFAYISYSRSF